MDRPDFPFHLGETDPPADVPRVFHSEYLSAPFTNCVDCDAPLGEGQQLHSVVKLYVGKETVFEMAICAQCSMRLAESYSEQSKRAFARAFEGWKEDDAGDADRLKGSQEDRANDEAPGTGRHAEGVPRDPLARLEHCAACGRHRSQCRRYAIIGVFVGRGMVSGGWMPVELPLMVCDECNSAANEGISKHTRDTWDRFVEENFDGPPGIEIDSPPLEPLFV